MLGDADAPEKDGYVVATLDGAVGNLKTTTLDDGTVAFAVTGPVTPNGKLYNAETAEKPVSSGRAYSSLFVRHWDAYVTENKSTVWYATLRRKGQVYELVEPGLKNALAGSPHRLESPVPPFGGTGDFDIGKYGIVLVAKDPKLNPALYTKTDLYYIRLQHFTEAASRPQPVITGNLRGYSSIPVFSPDGKQLAFTRMKSDQYESDKPRLLLLPDLKDLTNVQEFFQTNDGVGGWDIKPESITWSEDAKHLYITAEDQGLGKVFRVASSPRLAKGLPTALVTHGTVSSVKTLSKSSTDLLISSSNLTDSSAYHILSPSSTDTPVLVSSSSKSGQAFGLSRSQISSIHFPGAGDYDVHAFVMKPSFFDPAKRYPLAYLIHGGPQGAWLDSWSTRWNPAIFAEQGYIVVTPNPTGSSGYGMALQDGIRNEWGGRPYQDLVNGFKYIEDQMPYVDTKRAVALGASYGGYMVPYSSHPFSTTNPMKIRAR